MRRSATSHFAWAILLEPLLEVEYHHAPVVLTKRAVLFARWTPSQRLWNVLGELPGRVGLLSDDCEIRINVSRSRS